MPSRNLTEVYLLITGGCHAAISEFHRSIQDGTIAQCLRAASCVESLEVEFDAPYAYIMDLTTVSGQSTWPKLDYTTLKFRYVRQD